MELKPCPFCGGEPHITIRPSEDHTGVKCYIRCRRCDARSGRHKSAEFAQKAWNKRAENEELKFVRGFIHDHGLEFALLSAWNRRVGEEKT